MAPRIHLTIPISASREKVWDILTNPLYAKILGNELDKGAFLQSEWKPGAQVFFKYEPDNLIATGTITAYELQKHIFVNYPEISYTDSYALADINGNTLLTIDSGPYPEDYIEQQEVWLRWISKVKQLSEE